MSHHQHSAVMKQAVQSMSFETDQDWRQRHPIVLAVFPEHILSYRKAFESVKELSNSTFSLRVGVEPSVFQSYSKELIMNVTSCDWVTGLEGSYDGDFDFLYVPIVSLSLLNDLQRFDERRPIIRLIIKAMMNKKPVIMRMDECLAMIESIGDGHANASILMNSQYTAGCNFVKNLGVQLMEKDQDPIDLFVQKGERSLVSAQVVIDAYKQGKTEIVIQSDTLITPLARDEANKFNINLVKG